jgi:hypothetical protein
MRRLFVRLALMAGLIALTGCASVPFMPLAESNANADATPPLYLMTVEVKNTFKESWQPKILNITLAKTVEGGKIETRVYRMDDKGVVPASTAGGTTKYLVRLRADDSFRFVVGMNAMASSFPFHGFYYVPLNATLEDDAPGVYYLGSVQATIRERKDNEFRAGPVIPLIDQAVTGASTGTFDITIADEYEKDLQLFKTAFPVLTGATVTKKLLPPWDRSKAQLAWEKN